MFSIKNHPEGRGNIRVPFLSLYYSNAEYVCVCKFLCNIVKQYYSYYNIIPVFLHFVSKKCVVYVLWIL